MIKAAGFILRCDGKILFLRRTNEGDVSGSWAFPGGKVEDGEGRFEAAIRETREETGIKVKAPKVEHTRRIKDGVDFTTFIADVPEQVTPTLNEEHDAFVWAAPDAPPQPLHPGCQVALDKLSPMWDELMIAKAMANGDLTSPQFYENLALFDIRITGTGRSVRGEKRGADGKVIQEAEIVWRDPSIYLNQEFLDRCRGLATILEHPPGDMLDSEEYRERNVGSVFHPYIKSSPMPGEPDEVWAIAKILDMPAAKLMIQHELSTSPAVVWSDNSVNTEGRLEDGRCFLLEGKPSLLDHIAICLKGVWDKGGAPVGIPVTRGDSEMTAEKVADKAEQEKDILAAVGALTGVVNSVVSRFDSYANDMALIKKRFDEDDERRKDEAKAACDSFEFSKRKDGESDDDYGKRLDAEEADLAKKLEAAGEKSEKAADRRKDAEEAFKKASKESDEKSEKDEEEKSEKDEDEMESKKDRKDAKDSVDELKARADSLEASLRALREASRPKTDEELTQFARVQSRADSIAVALGGRARGPMAGESLTSYRRFFMNEFKDLSPTWKGKDLTTVVAVDSVMSTVEEQILSEALHSAESPASIKRGEIRRRTTKDDAGHTYHVYEGMSPASWMDEYAGVGKQAVKGFITNQRVS